MASATAPVSASNSEQRAFFASCMGIVVAIALTKLLFHIYFNNRYGYFRDEFDYISCGDHLAWGYVDQPPLIPFLIHISRASVEDSESEKSPLQPLMPAAGTASFRGGKSSAKTHR